MKNCVFAKRTHLAGAPDAPKASVRSAGQTKGAPDRTFTSGAEFCSPLLTVV
jgi:hypothetical protein